MNNKEEKDEDELKIDYNLNENVSKDKLCSNLEIVYKALIEMDGNIPEIKTFNFYKFLSSVL